MNLFVNTSVWSLAWRRDYAPSIPEISELKRALQAGDSIYTTGLVPQELLQGFFRPKAHDRIIKHFLVLPLVTPDRQDHIHAADLRNAYRRRGIQVGTIDALISQLCVRHDLIILTTNKDFQHVATVVTLSVWQP